MKFETDPNRLLEENKNGIWVPTTPAFEQLQEVVKQAKAISFDGCHKIYVLLDDKQVELMRSYGYGDENSGTTLTLITDPDAAYKTVRKWYEQSCPLRFVNATRTRSNPGVDDEFIQIIPQA